MVNLDTVLNVVIPIGVIGIFAALIYNKMKDPINIFFRWIASAFGYAKDKASGEGQQVYETVYRYG